MSAFIHKIKNVLLGDNGDNAAAGLSRQQLEDRVVDHFKQCMAKDSTRMSLLFPTCFHIYLDEQDYRELHPTFAFTAKDLAQLFTIEVDKARKRYPAFEHFARDWHFQFIQYSPGNKIDGVDTPVLEPHDVLVLSQPLKDPDQTHTAAGGGRVVMTMHRKDSRRGNLEAFNPQVLASVNILADDIVEVPITSRTQAATPQRRPAGYATLTVEAGGSFLAGAARTDSVDVLADEVHVCGRSAMNAPGGAQVCRLDSDTILTPHVIIRRNPVTGFYSIEARGDVVLNEVPLSALHLVQLPNHSRILLNGMVQIKFTIS